MIKNWCALLLILPIFVGCLGSSTSTCTLGKSIAGATTGSEVPLGHVDYGGLSVAQLFLATSDSTPTTVTVSLKRIGTFQTGSHTVTARIESSDTDGFPDGVPLATSATIDVSRISTAGSSQNFTFTAAPLLAKNTTYWLVLKVTYGLSSTNYIQWLGYDGAANQYTSGTTALNAAYETSTTGTYSRSKIGEYRFLIFNVGCS